MDINYINLILKSDVNIHLKIAVLKVRIIYSYTYMGKFLEEFDNLRNESYEKSVYKRKKNYRECIC